MDRELFERLLPELRQAGVKEIGLFYLGESFLLPWLEEAIAYAKHDVGFPYVFLTTNGSLATPRRVLKCIEAGLNSLKFSFNYTDAKQLREVAGVAEKNFDKVLDNIIGARGARDNVLRETGRRCNLAASHIAYDGVQGEKMQAAISEISGFVDEVYALPLYNQADLVGDEGERREWTVTGGNTGRLLNPVPPVPCWAVFREGHITYDGKLSACCFDHDGRFNMGDLTKMSFTDAWNSETFQTLRSRHLSGDVRGTVCEGCISYTGSVAP
tara:strand:+ start:2420 stop:3229 length:810 start_codon:yes stop_codon:yes gene_type:complete